MARTVASVGPDIAEASDGAETRVLLYLKGFGPGGVERIALRLADGLRSAGIDIAVIVGAATGPMQPPSGHCSVAKPWPVVGTRLPIVRISVSLWRQIRHAPPALLFCPGNAYTVVAVLLKLLLGNACPPIVAKISNDLQRRDLPRAVRPLYRLWLRIQGRTIDHFAVLSRPMAEEAMAFLHVPSHRVHVVPNPVLDSMEPPSERSRHRLEVSGRRFVAVGRLERQKNYPAMLRAFAKGARDGDSLTIFGEGRERAALTALATSLGTSDRVAMPGHCCDVRTQLRAFDVLLLSSSYEGLPGAVIEALSAGLGIIATRCCASMSDLLDQGALGSLVDCGDEAAFAAAIETVSPGTPDRPSAMRKVRDCTIEAAVPAYAALFAAVIAERQMRIGKPRHTPLFVPATTRPA